MRVEEVRELYLGLRENIEKVILGKGEAIDMVIAALFSGGHILLEDVPGSGKTMLAKTLAKSIDGEFKRIQMTPDLLPSDITGINFFNMKNSEFEFVSGPVFTNVLIADEINRATPKTQAGLLEAMEEKQVTIDKKTYSLNRPFIVIATENPIDTQGVYALPEAQIDRFAVKLSMDYPDHESMIKILKTHSGKNVLNSVSAKVTKEQIIEIQEVVNEITVDDDLLEYIVNIATKTREDDRIALGISTRGMLSMLLVAKSYAAMQGREYVIPDDIKATAPFTCCHRLILKNSERLKKDAEINILNDILKSVPVPTEE